MELGEGEVAVLELRKAFCADHSPKSTLLYNLLCHAQNADIWVPDISFLSFKNIVWKI